MTSYRLMDGVAGRPGTGSTGTQPPATSTAYAGNYIAGLGFTVTSYAWLEGYWWYVADSNQTHAAGLPFCLWQAHDAANTGVLIPGTEVFAGALSTGWNFIALPTPIPLSPYITYHAQMGQTNNFPSTQNQFGTGDPYSAGITNGPLMAYSSGSGSNRDPWNNAQMPFSTASADPTAVFAFTNDADDNLWLDVQVTDVAPAGATYRGWPTMPFPSGASAQDLSYTLGLEFTVSSSATLEKIWHYSAPTSTMLPTRCGIWVVSSQTELSGSDNQSPTWLTATGGTAVAGSGWVYCNYAGSGVTLAASTNYKVSTFANAGTAVWFAANANYWTTAPPSGGLGGWTDGPLNLPDNAHATAPGQNSWNQGSTWTYPATSTNPENDWIDVEVQSVQAHSGTASLALVPAFTAQAVHGHYRTASLALSPGFTANRVRSHTRSASLAPVPSFTAARTVARTRTGLLAVIPSFLAAGHNTANVAAFWAGEARGRWVTGGLSMYSQSVLSTQYVQIPVTVRAPTAYNPTSDTVQFAFTPLTYPVTEPSAWATGSWVTFPGPAYFAQCLVGPSIGGTALSVGTYQVWVKITDNPEVPVLQPSTLAITP